MGAMSRPYAESPTELPAMHFPTDLIARTKALGAGRTKGEANVNVRS